MPVRPVIAKGPAPSLDCSASGRDYRRRLPAGARALSVQNLLQNGDHCLSVRFSMSTTRLLDRWIGFIARVLKNCRVADKHDMTVWSVFVLVHVNLSFCDGTR